MSEVAAWTLGGVLAESHTEPARLIVDHADQSLWLGEGEAVDHPSHYHSDSGIEVIDAIEAWDLNFALGNAVKYCARAGHKDPSKAIEDLRKAVWYIEREIERHRELASLPRERDEDEEVRLDSYMARRSQSDYMARRKEHQELWVQGDTK